MDETEKPEDKLIIELLQEEWPDEEYRCFVDAYRIEKYDIAVLAITEERTKIPIENKVVPFTLEYAKDLVETSQSLMLTFFVVGKDLLWDIIDDFNPEIIPVDGLIINDTYTEKEKVELLYLIDSSKINVNHTGLILVA